MNKPSGGGKSPQKEENMKQSIYLSAKARLAKRLEQYFDLYEKIRKAGNIMSAGEYAEYVEAFWGTSWRGLKFPHSDGGANGKFFAKAVESAFEEAMKVVKMQIEEYGKDIVKDCYSWYKELYEETSEVAEEMAQQISEIRDTMR